VISSANVPAAQQHQGGRRVRNKKQTKKPKEQNKTQNSFYGLTRRDTKDLFFYRTERIQKFEMIFSAGGACVAIAISSHLKPSQAFKPS
jgi:hypothetical protein